MPKRLKSELKEYFKAGKRPTQGQFEDVLDSYVHLNKNLNSDFTDLNFSFPNNESHMAIDILFGNNFVNGFITVEIVGSYAYQNSVGLIKKQFQVGANPDNAVWYAATSRIVEAEGGILENIYIGNFEWDPLINQYKITIYHTLPSGNPYNVKISQQSVGELVISKLSLSAIYTKPVTGQNRHFINYNQNIGVGTTNPKSRLQVLAPASTPDQYGAFSIGDENTPNLRMGHNQQYTWIQSHAGSPLEINRMGNNTLLNRDGGNVGIGVDSPAQKLSVNGVIQSVITGDTGGAIELTNPAKSGANSARVWRLYNMQGPYGNSLQFWPYNDTGNFFNPTGYVLKISDTGNAALQGKFEAKDFIVSASPTADFVFAQDYNLREIRDLENFISEKQHLPEIPSAKEMTENGVTVGEFQIKLLQKIEELTLYAIAQHKEIEQLKSKIQ